jgi:vacuolar-type H+-ATPase subunit C/Vma6
MYVSKVYAIINWSDTLDSYVDITTYKYDVQNYTNILVGKIHDICVTFVNATNQTSLQVYNVTANSTNFINIQNGIAVTANNTYYTLIPNNTLSFDVVYKQNILNNSIINIEMVVYKYSIGDCNRDDIVDVFDAVLMGTTFGGTNVIYDMNKDGTIDVFDAVLLGNHFGETS